MSKIYLLLLTGSLFFFACKKESFVHPLLPETCQMQTANPGGLSYPADSVVAVNYTQKNCGIIPLSAKNYWVYQDSMYDNGTFLRVQYDTLRYNNTWQSPDGLIWWESNIAIGLPEKLYANDSAVFEIDERLFTPGIMDAKKEYGLFQGDSLHYLSSFDDNAAQARSVKLSSSFDTPAGSFDDCILFDTNARNYRHDQVFFKPGIGVMKYIYEKAPMGSRSVKLQQVSTLVSFHFE